MSFVVEEVGPEQIREQVVELYWSLRRWPAYKTIDDYRRVWRWLYRSMGEGRSRVWVAWTPDRRSVVGHIAVYPRTYRVKNHELRVIVPGSLLVHPRYRNTLIGPRLIVQPRSVIRNGEADMAFGYANPTAHEMVMRLGFQDFGKFEVFSIVRRWSRVLSRRIPAMAWAGPALDLASSLRRTFDSRSRRKDRASFEVKELSGDAIRNMDTEDWTPPPAGAELMATPDFLIRRFLESPFGRWRIFGLFESATRRLEGYVVISKTAPFFVWDCRVNHERLDLVDAIDMVSRYVPGLDSVSVSTLPRSSLASSLRRKGFIRRSRNGQRHISAYWLPDHPLADIMNTLPEWDLMPSSTHH